MHFKCAARKCNHRTDHLTIEENHVRHAVGGGFRCWEEEEEDDVGKPSEVKGIVRGRRQNVEKKKGGVGGSTGQRIEALI